MKDVEMIPTVESILRDLKAGDITLEEAQKWIDIHLTFDQDTIKAALEIALSYGQTDGAHHKTWVIDQIVRILTGHDYEDVIKAACAGEDGPQTYTWDEGIAP